jgi:predicted nucleotide-binding protein (sugar kinase/HSP70/actin superfamily)
MLFRHESKLKQLPPSHPLAGRKVWIPRGASGMTRAIAAAFRSIGLDADVTPPSDERTRELGARHTCGDECYPTKVTVGDFMKILERPGTDPNRIAFFMPSGHGPCRFGQYSTHLQSVLRIAGYPQVVVISPTCENGYSECGELSSLFERTAWRGLVASDLLLKLLLKTRPYERFSGSADAAHEASIADLCGVLEVPYADAAAQMEALQPCLLRIRERFHSVAVREDAGRPLIGIIGEIFCRLNSFSNDEIVRRIEEFGGEAWMADISEWIWYTYSEQLRMLRLEGRRFSPAALAAHLRTHFQKRDEHQLGAPFREDFRGCEEPEDISEVLQNAEPYLPVAGSLGEMVLNAGRAVYLARKGADGILDISPFSCMNGIVCEAIYPRISHDHAEIPIRNFWFDGTQSDLERDLGIYLELARNYQARKPWPRVIQHRAHAA